MRMLASALCAAMLSAPADEPALKVSVRAGRTAALVVRAKKAHTVPLADINAHLPKDQAIDVDGDTRARLTRVVRGPDALFLVIAVSWPSQTGNPMGRCGAGQEITLLWLALSPDFHVQQAQSRLIGSCWQNVAADPCPLAESGAGGGACRITQVGKPDVELRFDPAHPEQGLAAGTLGSDGGP